MIRAEDYDALAALITNQTQAHYLGGLAIQDARDILLSISTSTTRRSFMDRPLEDASSKFNSELENPLPELLQAVKALQQHVTLYYGSVNSFLEDNRLLVSEDFADLSALVGYIIDPQFIGESMSKLIASKVSMVVSTLSIVSGTVTIDAEEDQVYTLTLNQDVTLNAPINGDDLDIIRIRIVQDGTGGWAITLASGWALGEDIPVLVLNEDANSISYITAIYNEANSVWHIVSVIGGF